MKTEMSVSFSTVLGRVLYCTGKATTSASQSCLTLCNPTDCSPPGSSVHGVLETRILERVAMPFSRGSSSSRDRTWSPALQADSLLSEPPGKPVFSLNVCYVNS